MSSGFWIGFWIFLTAVLLLMVFHRGFRRFTTWAAAGCAIVAAVGTLVWWYHTRAPSISDLPVPPCGTPGADPKTCARSDLGFVPDGFVPDPICPPGVVDPDLGKCNCPFGQQRAKDNLTGAGSCYNPHDATQLAEHLRECTAQPGDPYKGDKIVADRRNIPCNAFDKFDNDCPEPPATPWPGCVSHKPEPWKNYQKPSAIK